jgi:meso-butanediol dehydrogenase/(S,S)-butanediol dehydrogenase/diacetyl reductase
MDFNLAGKVAVVTGGSGGIGAAAVELLVGEGAKVAILDVKDEMGEALAVRLGGEVIYRHCDVADADAVKAAIDAVAERLGGLNLLFNNAGVSQIGKTMHVTPEAWNRVLAINLSSAFYACRAAIPHMRRAGGGAIVNTASISGTAGDLSMISYNASKAGLINYTRSLAIDYGPENIRANAVCPGLIPDTPMTGRVNDRPGGVQAFYERTPLGRGGRPEEIARTMLFLASDLASFLTGQAIIVDGGLTCQTGMPTAGRSDLPEV